MGFAARIVYVMSLVFGVLKAQLNYNTFGRKHTLTRTPKKKTTHIHIHPRNCTKFTFHHRTGKEYKLCVCFALLDRSEETSETQTATGYGNIKEPGNVGLHYFAINHKGKTTSRFVI